MSAPHHYLLRTESISQTMSQSMLGLPGGALREILKPKGTKPWRGLQDMAADGKHRANAALGKEHVLL